MTIWTLDFETKSYADLKKVGAWVYSEDPTTQVICLCYAQGDGPVKDWWPGMNPSDDMPAELYAAVKRGELFEAHNVSFEISHWLNIMVKRYGWLPIPTEQWLCSMAAANYFSMPAALDRLAKVLGLPGKDPEGGRLITKYCKLHLKTAKPEIPPEDFQKFLAYCRQDVITERSAADILGDLPEAEVDIFHRWIDTNLRGLRLDTDGIDAAAATVDMRSEDLTKEFNALVGFNPTQRDKCMAWFADQGLHLENMQADYLDNLLEEGEVPAGPARRALQIRLEINKASTKKLDAMARQCGSDGRARFQTRYSGAATHRETGAGFQPLNLNRGFEVPKDQSKTFPDQLARDIGYRDPEYLDMVYGDAMDAVSKASRYWIQAAPGKIIRAGDFSSIEAVVLACSAQEEWKIEAFRNKAKIYELAADRIYGLPPGTVTKDTDPDKRQDGKRCLGADTQVLTYQGWKRIVDIRLSDKVWDGVSWAKHGGVVNNGLRPVITLAGIAITPDHDILCGSRWLPAGKVGSAESIFRLALATGSANLPSSGLSAVRSGGCSRFGLSALAGQVSTLSLKTICGPAKLQDALSAGAVLPACGERISLGMRTYAPMTPIADGSEAGYQPVSRAVSREGIKITEAVEYSSVNRGRAALQDAAPSSRISSACRAGTSRNSKWTASTTSAGMSPATFGFPPNRRMQRTNAVLRKCRHGLTSLKPVYDIANAGPLRRFTILTDAGPMIVHNCELAFGYQGALGAWLKFDPRPIHSDETIIGFNRAWREMHPATVKFWRDMEEAAIQAIDNRSYSVRVGDTLAQFEMIDEWLTMIAPDGARMWYYQPELRSGMPQWHQPATKEECAAGTCRCKPRLHITYMATKEGQWKRVSSYGGKLTENWCQFVSRQLLEPAKKRLITKGYKPILTVYDEVACENEIGFGSKEEFAALMMDTEDWAKSWPIGVDVGEGIRYSK